MYHRQVEWAKVLVEGKVRQIIINVEKECILIVLGRLTVSDPIQFVYKKEMLMLRKALLINIKNLTNFYTSSRNTYLV